MMPSFEELKNRLKEKDIALSHQRLKVLEYLLTNQEHPTVEQIYSDLQEEISTLSKTTVYNTLALFADAGIVRILTIENNETRYDIITENHGHFKCKVCGTIYNFRIDIEGIDFEHLNDFAISEKNVYFKGICPKCLNNKI